MSSSHQTWAVPGTAAVSSIAQNAAQWFAIHTRARHEKRVADRLLEQGLNTYLPLVKETHRWSDRKKVVEVPLFGCYVFAKFDPSNSQDRTRICRTDGVLQLLGMHGEAVPIPDQQIDAVRILVDEQLPYSIHPFLKIGERVRVRGGAMDGVEGILVGRNGDRTLVVSVDVIQRSLAVRIEGYRVEPV